MTSNFQDCCIGRWQWTGTWTKFSSIKNNIYTKLLSIPGPVLSIWHRLLHFILTPLHRREAGTTAVSVLCLRNQAQGGLSAQWHQLGSGSSNLKLVVHTVLLVWFTLEFHSTNRCWRKVKTHLLHQPSVISSSGSPVCVCCCPHLAGCPPTPDANFRQLFFFSPSWLLWASKKRHTWLVYSTLFRPVNCLRALTSPCQ